MRALRLLAFRHVPPSRRISREAADGVFRAADARPPGHNARPLPRTTAMTDTLPDRLATDPRSPFHDAALLERGIGIRFDGRERQDVEEYCVSEGWIRVPAGRARDRRGQPMTLKLRGTVEPFLLIPDAG
jgi:hypothetical protein